jgi:serine phosphatase RsbU (regulator of sigma subunit)
MKLRTRLIVVFLLLSVAPLGAITFYSYTSNVRALQEAAAHEADLLAAELGRRMQLVTERLTERVVHLLDLPTPPVDAAVESGVLNDQIANALGEAAILLNNVELPDRRPGRGRGGLPPDRQGAPPPGGAGEPPRGGRGDRGARPFPPPLPPPPGFTEAPPAVGGDRVTIDLEPIRRNLYRQIVPPERADNLTFEDRRRVTAEVNQRMLGIVEGLKLSAAELQRKADEARGRTSAFSGSRLDVTSERNGQVSLVKAELNLSNVLMTVFSTMGREKGEVPFAVDKDGRVYTTSDEDGQKVAALGRIAQANGPLGTSILPQWIVVTTADPTGSGLRFGIARPVGDSLASLRRAAGRTVGLGLLFIGLALIGIVPLSSRLTRDLTTLTSGAGRIASGDYGARVSVKARDEIGQLAQAFNQMAADIEQHQHTIASQERLKRELELGRQIQHDMLPHQSLQHGLTEIQGVSVPAREVGGDFFNYFVLPNERIALVVGDVSGKGVGAALLMSNIQASLRLRLALGQDLSAIASEIDADIDRHAPGPMYATLFLGILDPVTRLLHYVNAGHHPQFVLRRQGGLEPMGSTGFPVGLIAGHSYRQLETQLAPGDFLFFYTDGCVETMSESGEPFGAERLEELLLAIGSEGPNEVVERVGGARQHIRG